MLKHSGDSAQTDKHNAKDSQWTFHFCHYFAGLTLQASNPHDEIKRSGSGLRRQTQTQFDIDCPGVLTHDPLAPVSVILPAPVQKSVNMPTSYINKTQMWAW